MEYKQIALELTKIAIEKQDKNFVTQNSIIQTYKEILQKLQE